MASSAAVTGSGAARSRQPGVGESGVRLPDVEILELPLPSADVYWVGGYKELECQRVMLGVHMRDGDGKGAWVEDVATDSPAARAGQHAGEVIVAVEVERDGERMRMEVLYEAGRRGAE